MSFANIMLTEKFKYIKQYILYDSTYINLRNGQN